MTRGTLILITISAIVVAILGPRAYCGNILVVKGGLWLDGHAANQFAGYAGKLTGDHISVVPDAERVDKTWRSVVLIGNGKTNRLIRRFQDRGLVSYSGIRPGGDGFIIKTIRDGNRNYLILGGNKERATLYAVYHYLDKFCRVGFFEDGERVPRLAKLPFNGISLVSNPRFDYRLRNKFGNGHVMLSKYTHHFWDWPDYKRNIDYWAKRKLNFSVECFTADTGSIIEDIVEKVFHVGPPPEIDHSTSWPSAWDWPSGYLAKILRKELDYGRKLGFEYDYYIQFGDVPRRFKTAHPEIKYTEGFDLIDPSDPKGKEYCERYAKEIIKELGTDHIYSYGAIGEASPGKDPLQLKIDISLQMIDALKKVDPKFRFWRTDGWAFQVDPGGIWTKEAVKKYLSVIPRGDVYIADNTCDISSPTNYEVNGYYYGQPWAFGVINTLAGEDYWTGDLYDVLSKVKKVASSPEARNCVGFHMMPENNGTCPIYWEFMNELAWNPEGVTVESFLRDYTIRRYSIASSPNMRKCYRKVVEAMKYRHAVNLGGYPSYQPLYRFTRLVFYPELPADFESKMLAAKKTAKLWRDAIEIALREKDRQRGNKLYENDLVDMTRGYLACLFDYNFSRFILAARAGDKKTMDESEPRSEACLEWMEKILSTRGDFSLAKDIERVMKVPGTNPKTPEYIKERYIWLNYCLVDSFELMHYYNRPRVKAFMTGLRSDRNYRQVGKYGQFIPDNIADRWVKGSIKVDDKYKFNGSTVEAVRQAMKSEKVRE